MTLRVISYGGGVQSTALVVLAVSHVLDEYMGGPVDAALFANVGDDSEDPATLDYVRNVVTPWAGERGLPIVEVEYRDRGTLYDLMKNAEGGTRLREPIPIRGMNGAPLSRSCTADWKIRPIGEWLKARGASGDDKAKVAVGISTDEIERANRGSNQKWEQRVYPLLDLKMNRSHCEELIRALLPVPPKSACYFCPFHRPQTWSEQRRDRPELFEKSADLEDTLNARRAALGKDPVYLTRFGKPLREAVGVAQDTLFSEGIGEAGCDEGYCWT